MSEKDKSEKAMSSIMEDERLQRMLADALKEGTNRQLVLMSSAQRSCERCEALLIRGAFGEPECYWFDVDFEDVPKRVVDMVLDASGTREDELDDPEAMRETVAGTIGVAACFLSDVEGVRLKEALFAPLGRPIAEFMTSHPVTGYEVAYLKRSENVAHRLRRLENDERKAKEAREQAAIMASAANADGYDDVETLFD